MFAKQYFLLFIYKLTYMPKKANYKKQEQQSELLLNFKKVTLTEKQKQAVKIIKSNKISIITGPPGTSKTFTACYTALDLLKQGFCSKIILTKPAETIGSFSLGALPGTLDDKLLVYKECFIQNFTEIIEGRDINMLFEEKTIEFKPVQYMRGITFQDVTVIVDEFQSFDIKELMAIVTRLGKKNCKIIFLGDINQNDINKRYVGFNIFKKILKNVNDVGMFEFDKSDTMRDEILITILENYEKIQDSGELTQTKNNS
jgi:phosphate starvation-inducible PhoH-like protein